MIFNASTNSGVPVKTRLTFLIWCTETFASNMVEIFIRLTRILLVLYTFAFTEFRVVDVDFFINLSFRTAVKSRTSASAVFAVPLVVSRAFISSCGW